MKISYPKLHSIRMKNEYNVERLDTLTNQDIDPNRVLMWAINHGLSEVVVLGYDKDGDEYFASSLANGAQVVWHLELAKRRLYQITDSLSEERPSAS